MSLVGRRLAAIRPSATVALAEIARARIGRGEEVIDLAEGEPDFDTPAHIVEAACAALRGGQTRYTSVAGTPALRQAVCDKLARENGIAVRPEQVIVSTGAKQVIFNALMCGVDPGDEVLIPSPFWVSYPDMVRIAGGSPVIVPCPAEAGFRLTPPALAQAITPRSRWLILNSPGNPTGAVYRSAELAALLAVVARHPRLAVLSDEVYEHTSFVPGGFAAAAAAAPELADRILTVNGVSKAYAMTGWRIGYGAGPAELIAAMTVLQGQSTTNPSSVGQAAALAALTGPQEMLAERRAILQRRRDLLLRAVTAIPGLRCTPPEGGLYLFVDARGLLGGGAVPTDLALAEHLLAAAGIAAVPGSAFGCPGHLRLCFARPEPVLEEVGRRLARACADLARPAAALS
ncbi:MAG: pyridoxal phosphate-dependent aminotransferase [Dongiaceae bacterium]